MGNTIWPIRPTFLSLRKGAIENTEDPNKDGIFYADFIQGFLGALANDKEIEQPLSIFQFLPKDFDFEEKDIENGVIIPFEDNQIDDYIRNTLNDRRLIRIDSGAQFEIKPLCENFRKKEGCDKCYVQDGRAALYADKRLEQIENRLGFKKKLNDVINEYNLQLPKKEKIIVDSCLQENPLTHVSEEFVYFYYRCKYIDLDEYIFPIFYDSQVVACMLLGQICPKNHIEWGDEYISMNSSMLTKIFRQIKSLEERISNKIDLKKRDYIYKTFTEIKDRLMKNLEKIGPNDMEEALKKIKSSAGQALREICVKFRNATKFISIFAIETDTPEPERDFRLFITSDSKNNSQKQSDEYKFKNIDGILNNHFARQKQVGIFNLKKYPECRKEIVNKFTKPNEIDVQDELWLLPTLSNNVSFIIWKRPQNWTDSPIIKNLFNDELSDFYILIAQIYATMADAKKEKEILDIIRIASHESVSILFPMLDFAEKIEKMVSNNSKEKSQFQDFKDHVWMLRSIYDKPKLAFGLSQLNNKKWIHLSDILVHGAKLYRPYAADRSQIIPAPDDFATQISIEVDNEYFSQVINNLLNNAVKYSHEGTKIYIQAYREEDNLIVGVTSYGKEIKEKEDIYKLYTRGENQMYSAQGLGIGMFLSKKLALAHGFDLTHRSDKVSDYHLPVLSAKYFDYQDLYFNIPKLYFEKVVALKNGVTWFYPRKKAADLLINEATYENQFKITIPSESYNITQ